MTLAGLAAGTGVFTVQETEQALVLLWGQPRRVVQDAGLHLRWPLVERVIRLDKRILDFDPPPEEIIASDKKRLVVDTYTRYRIADPLRYYVSVGDEATARARLATIIDSSTRRILAKVELKTVLSGVRRELMQRISALVNDEAAKFGVDVVDVRIKRTDLPTANSAAIYQRMEAERQRDAKEKRAIGAEAAQKIKADADRQRVVLLADAGKQAKILEGKGDADRNRIYAKAYGADPEFFRFYRSMQAYRKALNKADTTAVLSPDGDFFRYFGHILGKTQR